MTRKDIQILRGVSLVGVLFFHANNSRFQIGYLGVDLFFVISGFVIVPRIQSLFLSPGLTRKLILDFYMKRILRLVPALLFSVLFFSPIIIAIGNVRDLVTSSRAAISALLFSGNLFPIGTKEDYFNSGANPFIHAWSLGLEFQIYFLMPLILLFLIRYFKFRHILLGLSVLSFALYLFLLYVPILNQSSFASNIAFYSPASRFWEFGVGGLIAQFPLTTSANRRFVSLKIGKILLFLVLGLLITPIDLNATFIQFGIVAISALYLALPKRTDSKSAIYSILLWIGDRSYSIYLVHLPLIYLAKYSPVLSGIASQEIRVVVSLLLSLIVGSISYMCIENRYRANSMTDLAIVPRFRLMIVYSLALILCIGQLILVNILNQNEIVFRSSDVQKSTEWDRECKLVFRFKPCEYNVAATDGSIFLFGDSHAAMFGKVFHSVAIQRNLKLYIWASPACQFFVPQTSREFNGKLDSCELNNLRIRDWVAKNNPKHMYLSVIDSKLNSTKYFGDSDTFANEIVESVRKISSNAVGKTIILPTPKLTEYSLAQYFRNNGRFALDLSYRKDIEMWQVLSEVASISTIESLSMYCKNDICRKRQGSRNIFADTDHLSVSGANLLRQEIIRALQP